MNARTQRDEENCSITRLIILEMKEYMLASLVLSQSSNAYVPRPVLSHPLSSPFFPRYECTSRGGGISTSAPTGQPNPSAFVGASAWDSTGDGSAGAWSAAFYAIHWGILACCWWTLRDWRNAQYVLSVQSYCKSTAKVLQKYYKRTMV